jgi:hypothetical protein
MGFEEN